MKPPAALRLILALLILSFILRTSAVAVPLSGTKSVGPTGDYASLTAAIADVQAVGNGLGGAFVLELQAIHLRTVEPFPLILPALNGASAVNTLTFANTSIAGATLRFINEASGNTVSNCLPS